MSMLPWQYGIHDFVFFIQNRMHKFTTTYPIMPGFLDNLDINNLFRTIDKMCDEVSSNVEEKHFTCMSATPKTSIYIQNGFTLCNKCLPVVTWCLMHDICHITSHTFHNLETKFEEKRKPKKKYTDWNDISLSVSRRGKMDLMSEK